MTATQAITVKHIPPSAKQPARYVARMGRQASFVIAADYPSPSDAIDASVQKLAHRLKLTRSFYSASLPDGRVVFVPDINYVAF